MSDHHEVERAYAVAPDDVLPDLTALSSVARATEPQTATLVATYLDTEDLALVRAGVSLRRRVGGSDEGWHLKVPAGAGRDEVRRPLGSADEVPNDLRRTVLGWTRGRDLRPVAVIETVRTTWLLLDEAGASLAEVADDSVVGTGTGAASIAWRELEIELVTAGVDLLDAAEALLAAASDIRPSREQRKIGTVLAERLAAVPAPPESDPDGPAGPVLHARLHEQVAALQAADCDVRRGVHDGVHQLRVSCRRLRGALATYRLLLDRTVTDPIREELRWLAQTLGDGRDAEVVHDRLRALVDDLPADQVVGPVHARLDQTYAERRQVADQHAQGVLDSARYLQLLDALHTVSTAPPWTDAADEPAAVVLPRRVARDWRRLRDRVETASTAPTPDDREVALHEARKSAKRLRYACEVLEPGWAKPAKRLRRAAQEITRVLGDRQDAAVGAGDLRRIADEATAAGESAFTYGVLHARDEATARALEDEFDAVWAEVRRPKLRRWLSSESI